MGGLSSPCATPGPGLKAGIELLKIPGSVLQSLSASASVKR